MAPPRDRMRQALAGTITALALLVASVTWVGFGLLHTALDVERSERVAEALLSDGAVRDQLRANLSSAVAALPSSLSPSLSPSVDIERARIDAWAGRVLESPVLEAVVGDALVRTHAAFLGEGELPETLDLTDVIGAAHEAAVAASPGLGDGFTVPSELVIDLPTGQVPDVGWLRRGLERFVPVGAVLAAIGVLVALMVATHRPSILRRAGFWAVGSAAVWLVVGVGVPWIATRLFAGQAVIAGALVESLVGGMTTPAIWLAGFGSVALAGSVVWLGFDPAPPGPALPGPATPAPASVMTPQPITVVVQAPAPVPAAPPGPAPAAVPPPAPSPAPSPAPPPVPPAPVVAPTRTPAPAWIEGIGYVDPVPEPDWIPGRPPADDDDLASR